ncbi:MAG: hypothetical protein A2132_03705 [Nitrospirae bacterium RBG_16_43_11]|nr:MAG: hypothetical protein A2132_03705 [Nitrospirae bacterium RBG_16_43_11]
MDSAGDRGTVDSAGGSGPADSPGGSTPAAVSLSDDSSAVNILPIEMKSIKNNADTNIKILVRFISKFNTIGKASVLSRINKRFTMAIYERRHERRNERNVSY